MDIMTYLPIMTYIFNIISENKTVLHTMLFRLFTKTIPDPMRLFVSVIFQQLTGIKYQSHYREIYPEIKTLLFDTIPLYGADKIKEYISKITDRMAAWKLIVFQSFLLRKRCPELLAPFKGKLSDLENETVDFDSSTLQSSSSLKEGAEPGYNKKNKGKSCFQLFGAFIGRVFADIKLFPGGCNPKDFFQKAVKRVISLGYKIKIIRADAAYMTLENLLFLTKKGLEYAIGAPKNFKVVKEGIKKFKILSRRKSSAIISVAKGVSIYDFGKVTLENGVETRIIIIRRISRRKNRKTGKWKIKTYYYGIASNLDLSARKLYEFYHKRQRIEATPRRGELKQHWNLEKLPFRKLIHNEFWIVCKIVAMTLFKIFQVEALPKKYQKLQRGTFFRRIVQKGLRLDKNGQVEVVPKARYTWLLRRLLSKTEQMDLKLCA